MHKKNHSIFQFSSLRKIPLRLATLKTVLVKNGDPLLLIYPQKDHEVQAISIC